MILPYIHTNHNLPLIHSLSLAVQLNTLLLIEQSFRTLFVRHSAPTTRSNKSKHTMGVLTDYINNVKRAYYSIIHPPLPLNVRVVFKPIPNMFRKTIEGYYKFYYITFEKISSKQSMFVLDRTTNLQVKFTGHWLRYSTCTTPNVSTLFIESSQAIKIAFFCCKLVLIIACFRIWTTEKNYHPFFNYCT